MSVIVDTKSQVNGLFWLKIAKIMILAITLG